MIPALFLLLAACALTGCDDACTDEVVGSAEACDDSCGAGARRFDASRSCLEPPVAICARVSLYDEVECAVSVETGEAYRTSVPLRFDETDAWIACDAATRASIAAAPPCGP